MVNDNRRAEQREVGGVAGHPGERAWRSQHRLPLLAAISQTKRRHLQHGLWPHQVSECEWWSVCGA